MSRGRDLPPLHSTPGMGAHPWGPLASLLTHQQGRVGVLGVKGALALPVQERLSSAAGHQREVLPVLWEKGRKNQRRELKQTPNLQETAADSLWPAGKLRGSASGETTSL